MKYPTEVQSCQTPGSAPGIWDLMPVQAILSGLVLNVHGKLPVIQAGALSGMQSHVSALD